VIGGRLFGSVVGTPTALVVGAAAVVGASPMVIE